MKGNKAKISHNILYDYITLYNSSLKMAGGDSYELERLRKDLDEEGGVTKSTVENMTWRETFYELAR